MSPSTAPQSSQHPAAKPRTSYRRVTVATLTALGALLVVAGSLIAPGARATTVGPGSTVSVSNLPYASSEGGCDPSRDGWHIVMNGVTTSSGTTPQASDFAAVQLTFADGSSGSATFTDMTGAVAHFLDATTNQNAPATIVTATLTFPSGTAVTDCAGLNLVPGLIDMRVFTGEPGLEYRETLASAT